MKLKIEDFRGKMFYISSIPEVFKWLLPKAKEYKFFITNKFNPNVDGVIEPRKNVLRDNVGDIVRRVSKKAFEHNIPYYSLEEVAGLFLDEAFFPVWICNETTFLYNSKSSILYLPEDGGIEVRIVDRYYPSSKTCHTCGHKKEDLKLKDRIYVCKECGEVLDRDYNASLNLRDAKKYTIVK